MSDIHCKVCTTVNEKNVVSKDVLLDCYSSVVFCTIKDDRTNIQDEEKRCEGDDLIILKNEFE